MTEISAPQPAPAPDTGGPAFPHPDYLHAGPWGMTLRDYFAAKALTAQISCFTDRLCADASLANAAAYRREPKEQVAIAAYEYADAMLKARGGAA